MTTSFDDDATTASIESAHDDDIQVSKAPIVVFWTGDGDRAHSLSHSPLTHDHVTFDVQLDTQSHTAFFKIIANLALKGRRSRSNIFLFIPPERIQSLDLVEQDEKSESAARVLGTSTLSLQFILVEPPALVVPKDDYIPKGETARATLEALQALSRATRLRVDLPSNVLAKERLIALCDKASTSGALKTMTAVANLAKLYGGKGGQIIATSQPQTAKVCSDGERSGSAEKGMLSASAHQSSREKGLAPSGVGAVDSPPSYPDLGHSPPSYPPLNKKRRRLDSESEGSSQTGLKIEEICRQGFNEIGRRLDQIEKQLGTLGSRLDRVEKRMSSMESPLARQSQQCSSERGDQGEGGLHERVGCIEERVTGLEAKLDKGLNDIDDQLTEVRYDFDTTTLLRIEEEMGVAQSQLEEFIRDEVRIVAEDIDETIREKLRDALS
jgi:hypothetical protein